MRLSFHEGLLGNYSILHNDYARGDHGYGYCGYGYGCGCGCGHG
jgi:hypothetical protein